MHCSARRGSPPTRCSPGDQKRAETQNPVRWHVRNRAGEPRDIRLIEELVLLLRLKAVVTFRGPVGLALISAAGWLAGLACERRASSPGSAAAWLVRGVTLTDLE
jgi:hypothetical protein